MKKLFLRLILIRGMFKPFIKIWSRMMYYHYHLWQTRRLVRNQQRRVERLMDKTIFMNPLDRRTTANELINIDRRLQNMMDKTDKIKHDLDQLTFLGRQMFKEALSKLLKIH